MKKKILIAAVILFANQLFAQKDYVIHGNLRGFDFPYVLMIHETDDGFITDSAKVTNGRFVFKGPIDYPATYFITTEDKQKVLSFYPENSNIVITGNMDSLNSIKITGFRTQDEADSIRKAHSAISKSEEASRKKFAEAEKNKAGTLMRCYRTQSDSLIRLNTSTAVQFISSHSGSFVSLEEFYQISDSFPNRFSLYDTLYSRLNAPVKSSVAGTTLGNYISSHENIQIGKPAPPFTQYDTSGKAVGLSDFKGKYVLTDFWASRCGPCRAKNPNVLMVYNLYKTKNYGIERIVGPICKRLETRRSAGQIALGGDVRFKIF